MVNFSTKASSHKILNVSYFAVMQNFISLNMWYQEKNVSSRVGKRAQTHQKLIFSHKYVGKDLI